MIGSRIKNLSDVVDWGLCVGCGACAYACDKTGGIGGGEDGTSVGPSGGLELHNFPAIGIRPQFEAASCAECSDCLSYCPGYTVDANLEVGEAKTSEADHEFGPVLEIWQGHAADPAIRHRASSGGLLTALSLYCLEREGMEFVLHSGADPEKPLQNKTIQSRGREDLMAAAGSRYAPASPCDGLGAIEKMDGKAVFIGKPCDTTAVGALRRERPELDKSLGLVLSFFCAGAPSAQGTVDLIESLGYDPGETQEVQYRGEGWPGRFRVTTREGQGERTYSYEEAWGRLSRYRSFRCHLCPDGLGRVSDIACGDAWHEYAGDAEAGSGLSLALVRTERGRRILEGAREAGYVELKRVGAGEVLKAQENLLARRRVIFGRLAAMRTLGVPIPKFVGFSLFRGWMGEPVMSRIRSYGGTLRRVIKRGLWRRAPLEVGTGAKLWEDGPGDRPEAGPADRTGPELGRNRG